MAKIKKGKAKEDSTSRVSFADPAATKVATGPAVEVTDRFVGLGDISEIGEVRQVAVEPFTGLETEKPSIAAWADDDGWDEPPNATLAVPPIAIPDESIRSTEWDTTLPPEALGGGWSSNTNAPVSRLASPPPPAPPTGNKKSSGTGKKTTGLSNASDQVKATEKPAPPPKEASYVNWMSQSAFGFTKPEPEDDSMSDDSAWDRANNPKLHARRASEPPPAVMATTASGRPAWMEWGQPAIQPQFRNYGPQTPPTPSPPGKSKRPTDYKQQHMLRQRDYAQARQFLGGEDNSKNKAKAAKGKKGKVLGDWWDSTDGAADDMYEDDGWDDDEWWATATKNPAQDKKSKKLGRKEAAANPWAEMAGILENGGWVTDDAYTTGDSKSKKKKKKNKRGTVDWAALDIDLLEEKKRRSSTERQNSYSMPSKAFALASRGDGTLYEDNWMEYANIRFVDSKGDAMKDCKEAFYSKLRPARDRFKWLFSPDQDERVSSLLAWIEEMSFALGAFGLHKFLQSRERGAFFVNAAYRPANKPNEPAFDWMLFDHVQATLDKTLQSSIAFYDPAKTVVVFVYLPSPTGKSVAIWRRKLTVPLKIRTAYQEKIKQAMTTLRKDYVIHVDMHQMLEANKAAKGRPKEVLPPLKKKKKRKWWQIFW